MRDPITTHDSGDDREQVIDCNCSCKRSDVFRRQSGRASSGAYRQIHDGCTGCKVVHGYTGCKTSRRNADADSF